MNAKTMTARALFKTESDGLAPGEVEAVVSVFGNVDHGGDRMVKGAFADTLAEWKASGDPIPFIWSHKWDDPHAHIGVITSAIETDEGLQVKAQLDLGRPLADQVHHLMKQRRVTQFSFGYMVDSSAFVEEEGRTIRDLTAVRLLEAGPTLLGMNDATRLIQAASARLDDVDELVGGKAGRVLSAKNETALRNAVDLLTGVLASVEEQDAPPKTGGDTPPPSSTDDPPTPTMGKELAARAADLLTRTRHEELSA